MSHHEPAAPVCRVCGTPQHESEPHAGFCSRCLFKIGIFLLIILIIASYMVWFGLL